MPKKEVFIKNDISDEKYKDIKKKMRRFLCLKLMVVIPVILVLGIQNVKSVYTYIGYIQQEKELAEELNETGKKRTELTEEGKMLSQDKDYLFRKLRDTYPIVKEGEEECVVLPENTAQNAKR